MIKTAFIRKEAKEILRTYRWWVVPIIFLFFAFSAPASVKFLPELLKGQLEAQNIKITFPEPGPVEAIVEYFKNLGQMGMLAVILLSMGLISDERSKGILNQILVKPTSKANIVLSKFFVHGVYLTFALILSAISCFLYTWAIFGSPGIGDFTIAFAAYLIYILLIYTITLFFSAICRNQIAAGGLALLSFFVLSVFPAVGKKLVYYSPSSLTTFAVNTVQGKPVTDITWIIVITLTLIVVLLAAAITIFSKQEF